MLSRRLNRVIVTSVTIFSAAGFVAAPAASAKTAKHCPKASRAHHSANACKASVKKTVKKVVHKPAPKPKPKVTPKPVTNATTPATNAAAPAPAPAPVASTAPCANGDLTPDPTNIVVVETATLCLVNQVRGQHGLPALVPNAKLQQSADRHNNDMVAQNYFAHNGPAGDTPLSRIEDTGYLNNPNLSYVIGENIAWGTLSLSTPSAIVNAWVNSPEHLANILNAGYTDSGLSVAPQAPAGLAQGQPGAIYTQDFGGVDNS
jgi:uncharacterized protein YkwD